MIKFSTISIAVLLLNPLVVYAQDTTKTIEQNNLEITVQNIIDNYLNAIGGKNLVADVEDRTTFMKGNIDGKKLKIIIEQKTPNKLKQTITIDGIKQVILYNGQEGVWLVEGKQIPIDGPELAKLKLEAEMKFLSKPELSGVKIEFVGTEQIDSNSCYKLKLSSIESISWYHFYLISTGLKIKELKEVKTEHGNFIQETSLSDYREVDGLKFPFNIKQTLGAQTIEMIVDSIKLNSGLDDNIFVIPD